MNGGSQRRTAVQASNLGASYLGVQLGRPTLASNQGARSNDLVVQLGRPSQASNSGVKPERVQPGHRIALPARLGGCGLPSAVRTSEAAPVALPSDVSGSGDTGFVIHYTYVVLFFAVGTPTTSRAAVESPLCHIRPPIARSSADARRNRHYAPPQRPHCHSHRRPR